MKVLIAVCALAMTSTVLAETRKVIQNFYLVSEKMWAVEGRFSSESGTEDLSNGNEIDVDNKVLNGKVFHGNYGKVLNLGGEFNFIDAEGDADGVGDLEFFARGRLESYLYEFRYFFSHDDKETDNAVSGGNHFWLKAGVFKYGWGFLATFQPEYDADVANSDDVNVGQQTILEGFYEHLTADDNTLALAIGSHHFNRGDLDDDDITEGFWRAYATFPFGGYDWI
ncbi:MAG: hypothetical protein CME64_13315 [Halobacteriovoraceae bacterium]|nr:hypothetical protein [Halobacteriovoraceae bacterium]